jgi:hypothetical protein
MFIVVSLPVRVDERRESCADVTRDRFFREASAWAPFSSLPTFAAPCNNDTIYDVGE